MVSIFACMILTCLTFVQSVVGFGPEDVNNPAFDPNFYEELLDPDLCQRQLEHISNNTMLRLAYAGLRVPRSILYGNLMDMGNYLQCLNINEELEETVIEGKYCRINVPLFGTYAEFAENFDRFNPNHLKVDKHVIETLLKYNEITNDLEAMFGRNTDIVRSTVPEISFSLAVCVPKPCTTQEGITSLLFNLTAIGFQYDDHSCRVKADKLWAPADYVAISIFSFLGLLTLVSTGYDLWQTVVLKKDAKHVNPIYCSFSVYTNTRRLTTFVSNANSLECVDGIRALAMLWVILGHTFFTYPNVINVLDTFEWLVSVRSFWFTAAPISVDTFFMLSGLLLVYTTAGKLTSNKLLKSLHLFYLNRILRMFPLLAAIILIQASVLHRIADGPQWDHVEYNTNACRQYWWTPLLYVQNYVPPMCVGHTWYLAIDMQLHIISPLFLYWILSNKKNAAWISLTSGLLISLICCVIYVFLNEFPPSTFDPLGDPDVLFDYSTRYYINTLTRASPFFVGMIFGYLLHIWRGKSLELSKMTIFCLWGLGLSLLLAAMMAIEPTKSENFNSQIYNDLMNSFMRPVWATGLGWVIFACSKGYGGPINWFLSLQMWKLLSRISYAMYLFHLPIMYVIQDTYKSPIFFSEMYGVFMFLSHFFIAILVGFFTTLIIDSPFSTLFKILLGGGGKPTIKKHVEN